MNRTRIQHMESGLRSGADIDPQALYIHIPFCGSRCHYCDFATAVAPTATREAYVEALVRELDMISPLGSAPLRSVFFGGGTPTLLTAKQLQRVLSVVRSKFAILSDAEITIEANPGTVTAEKLRVLQDYGVNRISFGAQTFNDTLLLAIGRMHDAQTVDESVELAQKSGFKRISVDLMFGLPDQTMQDVAAALDRFFAYQIEHVSAYWLKIESGTPFHQWQQQGLLTLPGEDAEGDMYDYVRETLCQHGFYQYEVSNFALAYAESQHNLVYWHNEPYLAAGVGAHGYVGQTRYENTRQLSEYMMAVQKDSRPINETSLVSPAEYAENTMMLGLRLREGVAKSRFRQLHGVDMEALFGDVIDGLLAKGLVQWKDDRLMLTPEAWPLGNLVFEEFVGALTDN